MAALKERITGQIGIDERHGTRQSGRNTAVLGVLSIVARVKRENWGKAC
jgi:hypothetical protein